jgi:hypothetical protein
MLATASPEVRAGVLARPIYRRIVGLDRISEQGHV